MATTTDEADPAPAVERRLRDAICTALQIVDRAGDDKVARIAVGPERVSIEPSALNQGESIAHALGLTSSAEYPLAVPGFTDFYGDGGPLEVHMRGAMRHQAGGASW